jgi:hypothetical protein
MARELSLNEARLLAVFDSFPGLYRRSVRLAPHGQHYYALQARYAQREGMDTSDPEEISYIPPLDKDKLQLVINFVSQAAEAERASWRAWLTVSVAMAAAIISAAAAVTAAMMRS